MTVCPGNTVPGNAILKYPDASVSVLTCELPAEAVTETPAMGDCLRGSVSRRITAPWMIDQRGLQWRTPSPISTASTPAEIAIQITMDFRDIDCLLSASGYPMAPHRNLFHDYLQTLSRIQWIALRHELRPSGIVAPCLTICCSIEIETMNQAEIKKAIALEGCSNSRRRLLRQLSSISLGLPLSRALALAF